MHRLIAGILSAALALAPASAGQMSLLGAGAPAASALDPATTAWIGAVNTAGGSVSGTRQGVVNTFITCLKSASLWTTLDRYWLLAGENSQSANIDMKNLGTWTLNGTYTFSANNGYTGDGSTGYGNSNYTPSTGGGNMTQNSATIGVQIQTNRTTGANFYQFGADDAGAFTKITSFVPFDGGGNLTSRVNSTAASGAAAPASVRHSWTTSRTGASANVVYMDGVSFTAPNDTSTGLPTTSLFFSALNFSGPFGYSTDQLSSFYFGGGWNSTQVGNFESCQNAMMTSIGINVH